MSLAHLSDSEMREALLLQERLKSLQDREGCQEKFLTFIDRMWPEFICGKHHEILTQNRKINHFFHPSLMFLFFHKVGIIWIFLWHQLPANQMLPATRMFSAQFI